MISASTIFFANVYERHVPLFALFISGLNHNIFQSADEIQ